MDHRAQVSNPGQSTLVLNRKVVSDNKNNSVSRENRSLSSAYFSSNRMGFTKQVNVTSTGKNIPGDAANEPSIAIDPLNPNKIVIGWRQFNIIDISDARAGYAYSIDGGQTWTFPGVIQPGVKRSDPVLDCDSKGIFYYYSVTLGYRCDIFKSKDGGATWDSGTFAQGGDKPWMTIDRTGGIGDGHIYVIWSPYWGGCTDGFFTRSTDGGASFEKCRNVSCFFQVGTLDVNRYGDLYVCGEAPGGINVAKSSNAKDSSQIVSWDFCKTVNLGGHVVDHAGPNPGGTLGQTWIAVDTSQGAASNNVYLLRSLGSNSNSDPLDVMFSRSTDGGLSWSSPVRINDDPTDNAWQWFGTMSVAPNGRIDVVWLDTRDNLGTYLSSLYYSYSVDEGITWSKNIRLSEAFNPLRGRPQHSKKMGDYFDMISNESGAHLAWANTLNGEQDVYYTFIPDPLRVIDQEKDYGIPEDFVLSQNYPNPFNPLTKIRFDLPKPVTVKIKVYNIIGQKIKTLLDKPMPAGYHEVEFNGQNLSSGIYLYRIEILDPATRTGVWQDVKKMILIK